MDGWLDGWMDDCCGFTLWHNFSMCRSRRHSHSISALWSVLLVLACMPVSLEASCVVCCTLSLFLNAVCMHAAGRRRWIYIAFFEAFLKFENGYSLSLSLMIKPYQTVTQNVWVFVFCGGVVDIAVALVKLQWSGLMVICSIPTPFDLFSIISCGTECWKCNENCSASWSFLVHHLMYVEVSNLVVYCWCSTWTAFVVIILAYSCVCVCVSCNGNQDWKLKELKDPFF